MNKYFHAFLLYIVIQLCVINAQDISYKNEFSLKLKSKAKPDEISLGTEKNARPRFPFLIGAELGKYIGTKTFSGNTFAYSFFLDVNLSQHTVFLKTEFGRIMFKEEKSLNYFLLGLNFTPLKQRYQKLYFNLGVGVCVQKNEGGGFFLTASPKYLFAVSDYFGISAGIKYLYSGSHILGLNFGIQFFEN